jgi:ketosteroid isomerase-like protein
VTTSLENDARQELQSLDRDWSSAMLENNADQIARFMSDDWVIIGPEGNVIDRARFLAVIKSGDLSHSTMVSDDWRVRIYGDTALVTAQVRSGGSYQGQAFATHERSTSVFVRTNEYWHSVLTQLTPISNHRSHGSHG